MSIDLVDSDLTISDLSSGGGKVYRVNSYKIVMKDGKQGVLRILTGSAVRVLSLLK